MRTNRYRFRVFPMLAGMLTSLLLLWPIFPAQAQNGATITVDTKKDEFNADGDCSLREGVQAANSNARVDGCRAGTGEDLVVFELGNQAKITLNPELGQLDVTDDAGLTVDGGNADITVSGDNAVRVFQVNALAELALRDLTVADADAGSDFGGGIRNTGSLMVVRSIFSGNSAGFGGGIFIDPGGTIKVTSSTFHGNSARDGIVVSGFGGGIDNRGTLEVSGSTFSRNSADRNGGGLRNGNMAEVTNSTFFGNSAANSGGGTANNGAMLEVTNSTFSENSAEIAGGGVESVESPNTATLRNTIVSNSPDNCAGPVADGRYNISDDDSCAFTAEGSKNDTNPKLSPEGLKNRGGPTKTIGIRPKSPAVDAIPGGANGCETEVKKDQRGVKRPQGKGCDIGALERNDRFLND